MEIQDTSTTQSLFYPGDANDVLEDISPHQFDLIITSPPYNIGKSYETVKSVERYVSDQTEIIEKLVGVLAEHGSICWQVGNLVVKNGEILPLDILFYPIFAKLGLSLRNRIVWRFEHGFHSSGRFSGRYETILWFTKSKTNYTFNLDPVRIPVKYPGKKHFKGPNKGKYSSNPLGKNPSDVWDIVVRDWELEIWNVPNVKAKHPEKTPHPCQYPIELVERCVLALTNPGDWILDPFAGVGSTMIAAYKNGRNAVAIERYPEYLSIAEERLEMLKKGELPLRPITRPIYDHTKSKLSQMPPKF